MYHTFYFYFRPLPLKYDDVIYGWPLALEQERKALEEERKRRLEEEQASLSEADRYL